jgi:ABC-type uncharacterized transport system permease subunit
MFDQIGLREVKCRYFTVLVSVLVPGLHGSALILVGWIRFRIQESKNAHKKNSEVLDVLL